MTKELDVINNVERKIGSSIKDTDAILGNQFHFVVQWENNCPMPPNIHLMNDYSLRVVSEAQ